MLELGVLTGPHVLEASELWGYLFAFRVICLPHASKGSFLSLPSRNRERSSTLHNETRQMKLSTTRACADIPRVFVDVCFFLLFSGCSSLSFVLSESLPLFDPGPIVVVISVFVYMTTPSLSRLSQTSCISPILLAIISSISILPHCQATPSPVAVISTRRFGGSEGVPRHELIKNKLWRVLSVT